MSSRCLPTPNRDPIESVRWDRLAAEAGHIVSQSSLGSAYVHGEDVPQDYVEAYKWLDLIVAGGQEHWKDLRDEIEAKLTPQQLAEARRRASEWRESHHWYETDWAWLERRAEEAQE